jgi:hypothetical protein
MAMRGAAEGPLFKDCGPSSIFIDKKTHPNGTVMARRMSCPKLLLIFE